MMNDKLDEFLDMMPDSYENMMFDLYRDAYACEDDVPEWAPTKESVEEYNRNNPKKKA